MFYRALKLIHFVIKRSKKNLLKGFPLSDYFRNDLARNEFSGFCLRLQQYNKGKKFCPKEHIMQFRFIYLHYLPDQRHTFLRSFYYATIKIDSSLDHEKIIKIYYLL